MAAKLLNAALMTVLASAPVAAQTGGEVDPIAGYSLNSWTEFDDGLHSRGVYAITQDRDGYLWLGFLEGLTRFDGTRFVSWQTLGRPALAERPVTALTTARDGGLWIGFGNLGGVSRYVGGTLRHFTANEGVPEGAIRELFEDRDGTMWVVAYGGIARFRQNRWERVPPTNGISNASRFVLEDHDGTLWIISSSGVFRRNAQSDQFDLMPSMSLAAPLGNNIASALTEDGAQEIFARLGPTTQPEALRDRHGQLWAAARDGLLFVHEPGPAGHPVVERITSRNGLTSGRVTALIEDRQGGIWVGSSGGLSMLRVKQPAGVTQRLDPEFRGIRDMAAAGDGLWIATPKGLAHVRDHTRAWYTEREGLPGRVSALHVARTGVLWVATDRGVATFEHGRFTRVPQADSASRTGILSMTTDPEGGLWLCGFGTLARLKGGVLADLSNVPALTDQRASVVYTDSAGRVWIGLWSGAVVSYQQGTFRSYSQADGVAPGRVTVIHEDDAHALWVGTLNGFSRLDGDRFSTVDRKSGLSNLMVGCLTEDAKGYVWLGTYYGLIRLQRQEFDRAARDRSYRPRYRILNPSDGVDDAMTSLSFQSAARAPDGTLWFGNGRGLVVVSPGRILDMPPPATRIEQVSADERTFPPAGSVRLSAHTSRVQIDYTTLTFASPARVQFRYKLDGFDRDWVDAGLARRAVYTNLPPRDYRFRVAASHDGSEWSEAGNALDLTVVPAFYETASFYGAVVACIGLLVWAAWQTHLRRVRRQYALVFAERARLGREIHDTLLQGMVGVALQVHGISETLDPSASTIKGQLDRARDTLEHYIRETRLSIWDLRSAALERRDLGAAIRHAGETITAGSRVDLEVAVRGKPIACDPRVEEHLLRIGHEAITNAVRHGGAARVRVELAYEAGTVRLSIRDDGQGFDAVEAEHRPGNRWGLTTMRERAQQIGARFRCDSSPGGTEIEAVAPIGARN